MAKFFGYVGYSTETVETNPGVFETSVHERQYYGDVIRNAVRHQEDQKVLDDISVDNSISIVADAYAIDHFFAMVYVEWAGVFWDISSVEVQSPRLVLRLGGVYHGPKPVRVP